MSLTKLERQTVRYYDEHILEWIDPRKPGDPSSWSRQIETFKELLPEGRILEIGTGSGREAVQLIGLGYDYTGVDASSGLIREAEAAIPQGKFFHRTVYDLDFPPQSFDGFWTAATLLHIPKNRIQEALTQIRFVVRRGGIGFISLKEGEGEGVEKSTGRLFTYYSSDEFIDILKKVGMDLVKSGTRIGSDNTHWVTFFVSRA